MSVSLSNNDRLSLISNLATLLSAGIPILESVESLLEDAKGNQKKVLVQLKEDLGQGKTVSFSFSRNPDAFDPVTNNLIKASEESGNLDTVLKDMIATIKKDIEFTGKVKTALTYPLFVTVVFLGVFIVILTFVVPRVAKVFQNMRVDLPLSTQIMIALSNFFLNYYLFIVIGGIATLIGLFSLYRSKRRYFLNIFFSFPLISKLARMVDITRFSRSMALLLSSGIPITEALDLCKDVVLKQEVSKAIITSHDMVASGKKLSDGFRNSKKIIPTIMIRITEAGEKSGTLDKSMQDISEHFDNEVSEVLKTVTSLIEPVLLVVMGLAVGAMMMAIISPIYQLIGNVQIR